MRPRHWQRRLATLDPRTDATEMVRVLATHEFCWDVNQVLSLALFRTYAVPSIGALLARPPLAGRGPSTSVRVAPAGVRRLTDESGAAVGSAPP